MRKIERSKITAAEIGHIPHAGKNVSVILQNNVTALLSCLWHPSGMKKLNIFIYLGVFMATSGPVWSQTTVVINEADCDSLVAHVTSSDVAYTPGVDVNGGAVAPADLNAQPQIQVPDVISIPVTIDLATNLGIQTPFLARPIVGDVQVTRDGRVSFNGQPINSDAQFELAKRCQLVKAK